MKMASKIAALFRSEMPQFSSDGTAVNQWTRGVRVDRHEIHGITGVSVEQNNGVANVIIHRGMQSDSIFTGIAHDAEKVMNRFASALAGEARSGSRTFWFVAGVAASMTLVMVVAILATSSGREATAPDVAAQAQTTSGQEQAPQGNLALQEKALTELVAGIPENAAVMRGSPSKDPAKRVYVWSDPTCPHCQAIETELEKLADRGFRVWVMPTPLRNDESDMYARQTLCAKDRNAAWKKALAGGRFFGEPDRKCSEWAYFNQEVFRRARFEATPTIVTGNGRLLIGEASADEIEAATK